MVAVGGRGGNATMDDRSSLAAAVASRVQGAVTAQQGHSNETTMDDRNSKVVVRCDKGVTENSGPKLLPSSASGLGGTVLTSTFGSSPMPPCASGPRPVPTSGISLRGTTPKNIFCAVPAPTSTSVPDRTSSSALDIYGTAPMSASGSSLAC
jgi:hypothetical protein